MSSSQDELIKQSIVDRVPTMEYLSEKAAYCMNLAEKLSNEFNDPEFGLEPAANVPSEIEIEKMTTQALNESKKMALTLQKALRERSSTSRSSPAEDSTKVSVSQENPLPEALMKVRVIQKYLSIPEFRFFNDMEINSNQKTRGMVWQVKDLLTIHLDLVNESRIILAKMFEEYSPSADSIEEENAMKKTAFQKMDLFEKSAYTSLAQWTNYFHSRPNVFATKSSMEEVQDAQLGTSNFDNCFIVSVSSIPSQIRANCYLLLDSIKDVAAMIKRGNMRSKRLLGNFV